MRICFFPRVSGGGPASFQFRLGEAFIRSGIEVTYSPEERPLDAVLVFSGTRHLDALVRCRRHGIRIVQRLDGIHWLHRFPPIRPAYFLRAEIRNFAQRFLRRYLADRVIYQSEFVRGWWEGWYGAVPAPSRTVHNGIPMKDYPIRRDGHDGTLLVVEGNLHYNRPTLTLLKDANRLLVREGTFQRMSILGRVDPAWEAEWPQFDPRPEIAGLISREEARRRQLSAAAFLSAEINPPCPNAVLEAMAAGLPVIGLDTGALRELTGEEGVIAPYGGDAWKLEEPAGVRVLADLTREMMHHWEDHSRRARLGAERKFDMDTAAAAYREVLAG